MCVCVCRDGVDNNAVSLQEDGLGCMDFTSKGRQTELISTIYTFDQPLNVIYKVNVVSLHGFFSFLFFFFLYICIFSFLHV